MATIVYRAGESGTLGFVAGQFDGGPLPTEGLAVRLIVHLAGADLILPGEWRSGEVVSLDGLITHPSIAAFGINPDTMPLPPRAYRCSLQIDDGSGWRSLDEHVLEVRRP